MIYTTATGLTLKHIIYSYFVYLNNVFRYHDGKMCSTSEEYFEIWKRTYATFTKN